MRLATWNLERPSRTGWKIPPRQRQRIAEIAADVWVLTETRASVSPGAGYDGVHSPPFPTRRDSDEDERYVSVWSRWPIRATAVEPHCRGSASALVETPKGPLLVNGCVIAYAHDKGTDGTARAWQRHAEELARQAGEWLELQRLHPGVPLMVAGDMNQTHDGARHGYGTWAVREQLLEALDAVSLRLVTTRDVVASGEADVHLVDHVAVPIRWSDDRVSMSVIGTRGTDGVRISDHANIIIDVED